MKHLIRRAFIVVISFLPLLLMGSLMTMQSGPCGTMPDGSIPIACVTVKLSPDTLVGDFIENDVTIIQQASSATFYWFEGAESLTAFQLDIKNIKSTEPDFGTLFTYADSTITVQGTKGRNKTVTIKPQKNYIRGTLKFTCDVKNAAPTDTISCRVTIDSVVQPDVDAGQAASYILDPGDRLVLVDIVGEQANLFDPSSKEQAVKIAAGTRIVNLKVTFTKKGHLSLGLDQAEVVADFYMDGTQIATQVATYDLWVAPNKNHKIEAKNFTDPTAAGVYTWKDASQNVNVRAGTEKPITFKLKKQYLKGFLVVKCNISNLAGAYCTPAINGIEQTAIAAGTSAEYTLDLGAYSVIITPGPVGSWKPVSLSRNMTIRAGQIQTISATFAAVQPTSTPLPACDCSGDIYNCSNFGSQSQAQACFNYCMQTVGHDVHQLDRDNDGGVCESLP